MLLQCFPTSPSVSASARAGRRAPRPRPSPGPCSPAPGHPGACSAGGHLHRRPARLPAVHHHRRRSTPAPRGHPRRERRADVQPSRSGTLNAAGRNWAWRAGPRGGCDPRHPSPSWSRPGTRVTPPNTAVQVQARVREHHGKVSSFKVLGTWASRDDTSAAPAPAPSATPSPGSTPTPSRPPRASRSTATSSASLLLRTPGSTATPTVRSVHAVASRPGDHRAAHEHAAVRRPRRSRSRATRR